MKHYKVIEDAHNYMRKIEDSKQFIQKSLEAKVAVALFFAYRKNNKIKSLEEIAVHVRTTLSQVKLV